MKNIESNTDAITKKSLYKRALYKITMLFMAILFIGISELIMWLGISKIKSYYLWIGDTGSAVILGACILTLVTINALIIGNCLGYVFKDTKISNLFKSNR